MHVPGHGEWTTDLHVVTAEAALGQRFVEPKYEHNSGKARPNMEVDLDHSLAAAPRLQCDWDWLKVTYDRSLTDLAALRFQPSSLKGQSLPAAGLPWFMTVFGRDSIITSLQALPFTPELARATLYALAHRQGTRSDDFREEDPGKIMHEVRFGEMTAFEERPHRPTTGRPMRRRCS